MNILIADDHPTNRKLLRAQLEAEGCHIREASNGIEALEVLEREKVDLIISDILMPRMDGYRLCYEVRKSERFRSLPFIFLTATYTSPSDEKMSLEIGADLFLRKPASQTTLNEALELVRKDPCKARSRPMALIPEESILREYSDRLVEKLESKNIELAAAVEELSATRGQLLHLLEHSPAVIYSLRVEGEKVIPHSVSQSINGLLGYTVEESRGFEWWANQLHPADRDQAFTGIQETILKGALTCEYRIRHKDGHYVWVGDNRKVVRDALGKPIEIAGVWMDITDRKTAEAAVRESEERFRQLAENINEVFWMTDPAKHQMLYISPAYEIIWGRAREDLYRMPVTWAEAIHPNDRKRVLEAAETKQSSGRFDETYRIMRPDGSMRWIRDRAFPVRDHSGQVYRIVGTAQDITDRKRAEVRTDLQYSVTRTLADAAPWPETTKTILELICRRLEWDIGALWTVDRVAKVLRCVDLWHPPSSEFLEFADRTRTTSFAIEEDLPGQVWAAGTPIWIVEVTESAGFRRRAEADKLGLRCGVAFPIKLPDKVLGVVEFFTARPLEPDSEILTMLNAFGTQLGQFMERKQLEEQFRQAQKMEAIGQLAGGVAHDFNNLITVIQGYTQMLLTTEKLDPQMAEELQQVFVASQRAARLTSQLLTFSRKQVMQPRLLDLNGVVQGVSKMLQRIIGEDVTLVVEPARSLPSIHADPGMVEQVLMNLAVNARDAMRHGGSLTLCAAQEVIEEISPVSHPQGRPGDFVCLKMTDSGCGMTAEIMNHIFEPFFTTKAAGKGTGLGLATVHGIAQQHGGWVEAQSKVGQGATFKVYFPAVKGVEQAVAEDPAPSKARGGNETILLVEDETALRDLAKRILSRLGYRILEAGSGATALVVWEQSAGEIALVVTDMVMPGGMTGRGLVEQLHKTKPSLKVIYSSGYSVDALEESMHLELGVNYLPKPYNPAALAQIVRKNLDA